MDVNMVWTTASSDPEAAWTLVSRHPVEDLPQLLGSTDGLVWVDIPDWDDEAERVLSEVFCFHPLAIKDCKERNHVPKVHLYPGYVSWSCTPRPAGRRGTSTTSNWISSSGRTTWSPCTARSTPRSTRRWPRSR